MEEWCGERRKYGGLQLVCDRMACPNDRPPGYGDRDAGEAE